MYARVFDLKQYRAQQEQSVRHDLADDYLLPRRRPPRLSLVRPRDNRPSNRRPPDRPAA